MSILERLIQMPFAAAIGYALLHFLWQGALLALVVAVTVNLRSPRVRYAVACAALGLMPILFAVTLWQWLPAGVSPAVHAAESPLRVSRVAHGLGGAGPVSESWQSRLPWLALCWMAGVVLLWARAGAAWAMAQRLRSVGVCAASAGWQEALCCLRARLRMSRPVLLLESGLTQVPAALGFFRPVILMPAGLLAGIPAEQVEAFLIHELAHIRRCDYLINLAQTWIESLLFYHPAVWWVSAKVRAERENCCDDVVVSVTGDARGYAAALTTIEERRWAAAEAALAANGGNLMKRVRRLLGQERPRTTGAPLLGLLLVPAGMALAAWHAIPSKLDAFQIAAAPVQLQAANSDAERHVDSNLDQLREAFSKLGDSREFEQLTREIGRVNRMAQTLNAQEVNRTIAQASRLIAEVQRSRPDPAQQQEALKELEILVSQASRQLELERVNRMAQTVNGEEVGRTIAQASRLIAEAQASTPDPNRQLQTLKELQEVLARHVSRPQLEQRKLLSVEQIDRLLAQIRALVPSPDTPYQKWVQEDVAYIITAPEKEAFAQLQSDAEREQFIEQFWQRRDPTPGTPQNEFKEEHYRRIAFANDHFGFPGTAGWRTDRGRIYIQFGPPDAREVYEKGGTAGDGKPIPFPFERWRYRYIDGVGNDVLIEFVDSARTGNYRMTMDPAGNFSGQRFVAPPKPQ